jgi:hypothetical protein
VSHACHEARWPILNSYREALRRQILTPAPDVAAVTWKKRAYSGDRFIELKKERLEQIVADDIAFLKAHPTRKVRPASNQS